MNNYPDKVMETLLKILNIDSEAAALVFHQAMIEQICNALLKHNAIHGREYSNISSIKTKYFILHDLGVISQQELEILELLRGARNKIAHEALIELPAITINPGWYTGNCTFIELLHHILVEMFHKLPDDLKEESYEA